MPIFTIKHGHFPNFATQNVKHTTIYCGVLVCLKIETTIFCGLLSLNYRNSLNDKGTLLLVVIAYGT
ncbi:MAG: hypothetical protein IIY04_05650, partial [Oscillospiraceae bacterium]|nr:hypothetical protein [Oscillospiraceae bacterium]